MLKYRLLVGIPMAAAALGLLAFDIAPSYPALVILVCGVGWRAATELDQLFPTVSRPHPMWVPAVVLVLLANWVRSSPTDGKPPELIWPPVVATLTAAVLGQLVQEVRRFTGDGHATARAASGLFALLYLGLLPSFLVRLRWLPEVGLWAVVATVFVPKVGDIGAYFTGRAVGRHKMAPTLSPKKTWEGFAGGLAASAGTAVGIGFAAPLFPHGPLEAAAFGLVVGTAGVLGDLFESLLKRDAQVKDASATLPGFGGVLDVIDSILFAAPVSYLWFTVRPL